MSRKDIIRWVIDWMSANEAAITEELAMRCEQEARREWGGQRIEYVAKYANRKQPNKIPTERHSAIVRDALDSPEPMHVVAQRNGISTRTLYRLLKRGT